jgi:SAM-dependent methyltransferase
MNIVPFRVPPLNQHYEGSYSPRMFEWRRLGARDKAENLATLIGSWKVDIDSVLDVGCGTGAVLAAVAHKGIGRKHFGIDMADPSIHADPSVEQIGCRLVRYDGVRIPQDDASFDLVYASHVLEHVSEERGFLSELLRVHRKYIYIEVPCELHIRTTQVSMQRSLDIGHINVYTPESFALTLATSGMQILKFQLFDHHREVHRFEKSALKADAVMAIRRTLLALNSKLASRIFSYHCGALVTAA